MSESHLHNSHYGAFLVNRLTKGVVRPENSNPDLLAPRAITGYMRYKAMQPSTTNHCKTGSANTPVCLALSPVNGQKTDN
jgi:hypothetical protein